MKKTMSMLLAALMLLSLCACGGTDKNTADNASASQADKVHEKILEIIGGLSAESEEYDPDKAVEALTPIAEEGEVEAQYYLGWLCYDLNEKTERNIGKALDWFVPAAEGEFPKAYLACAVLADVDEDKMAFMTAAAESGIAALSEEELGADGMYFLGCVSYDNGDSSEAAEYFEASAALGSVSAMSRLGVMYRDGVGGEADYSKAETLLSAAAERGDLCAAAELGDLYYYYLEDAAAAKVQYIKAADAETESVFCHAAYCLGLIYADEQDYESSNLWLEKGIEAGDVSCKTEFGNHCMYGLGVELSVANAYKYWREAATDGSADAMYSIGLLYNSGDYLTKDVNAALSWFRAAADRGHSEAAAALKSVRIAYKDRLDETVTSAEALVITYLDEERDEFLMHVGDAPVPLVVKSAPDEVYDLEIIWVVEDCNYLRVIPTSRTACTVEVLGAVTGGVRLTATCGDLSKTVVVYCAE